MVLLFILSLNILTRNIPYVAMSKRQLTTVLRQIRLDAGLTQATLAQQLGQTQSYVSKYESGEQRLDLTEIEEICNVVGISLLDFVDKYLATR
ncbi:helix-turn-helix domain-containing protein [Solimonas flava]|uniref:helix-turn-helix domain-containing protein n=1 Tax=Solimonas flava TaxID=415849 RepID=UPI001B7F7E35|nr:helix-turn-helix transcriptional regulator [Solimonas flava]